MARDLRKKVMLEEEGGVNIIRSRKLVKDVYMADKCMSINRGACVCA
jgi:hypothetical protein